MTCRYVDQGTASDWLKRISLGARPIRSTTQIWVVTRHRHRISKVLDKRYSLLRLLTAASQRHQIRTWQV